MSRRLPAEWEPQDGVMLTWPHDGGDWAPYLPEVEPVFVRIAEEIGKRQRLLIVCRDEAHRGHIRGLLSAIDPSNLRLHCIPSNDTWARDHGPISVMRDGVPLLCDFGFNGWGGKFAAELDDRISATLHAQGAFGRAPREPVDLILEGGGIETDGQGTLLVTRRCLLSESRNPGMTQERMESRLTELFGTDRFFWLDHGSLDGDDTDGHIDTLARFSDPRTILYQACDDPEDPNHTSLKAMETELQGLRDGEGNPYRLIPLPSPRPIHNAAGDQLPAGYANFLVINGAVLVPTYQDPADAVVLDQLTVAFPCRAIVPIDCRPLILQYGSLHCVTMQLPEGVLAA